MKYLLILLIIVVYKYISNREYMTFYEYNKLSPSRKNKYIYDKLKSFDDLKSKVKKHEEKFKEFEDENE
jgi:ABC-type multidrug transport system fused ATPase/permease subunit